MVLVVAVEKEKYINPKKMHIKNTISIYNLIPY